MDFVLCSLRISCTTVLTIELIFYQNLRVYVHLFFVENVVMAYLLLLLLFRPFSLAIYVCLWVYISFIALISNFSKISLMLKQKKSITKIQCRTYKSKTVVRLSLKDELKIIASKVLSSSRACCDFFYEIDVSIKSG